MAKEKKLSTTTCGLFILVACKSIANMSNYMDEVDKEFIKCLFPEYLLQQPVAYYLWMMYYQHKRLFNKMKHNSNNGLTGLLSSVGESSTRLPGRLPDAVRKEIWRKLMNLGVLGTLSFNSSTDEYLMQVYKYFFPVRLDIAEVQKLNSSIKRDPEGQIESGNPHRVGLFYQPGDEINMETEELRVPSRGNSIFGQSVGGNGVDDDDEADEDDEDDENDDENNEEEDGEADEGDDIAVEEDGSSHEEERASSHASNEEVMNFYPALATSSIPSKSKNNTMVPDIYQMLGYFLPSQWTTQPNKSILLSGDGISQLSPHPTWQAYMGYDKSGTNTRNRLRNSFSGGQKNDYAVTWANNPLPSSKLGIFYYEIKVLNVTSSQGAQNSNIIVGYKQWLDVSQESASRGSDNDQASSTSSGTSGIGIGPRSSLRGRGSAEGNNDEPPSGTRTGVEEGFFGYCGNDGSITAGSQFKSYSKSFGRDDVIGCGVNYVDGTIFFTKNGVCLGTAFTDIHDITLIPYIALRSGNSVRTNFGLYEEFVFDILGYQDRWKTKAYRHIFKSTDRNEILNEFDSEDEDVSSIDNNGKMDVDEEDSSADPKGGLALLPEYHDGQMLKPDVDKINTLNTADDSIPSNLHTMINDYLIREGLIDVAKGFLTDLKKDALPAGNEGSSEAVIGHNEKQIIKEEKNLKIRQDLRRFITGGHIDQCLQYIDEHLPGLLQGNTDLLFELELAQYLLIIRDYRSFKIEEIVQKGQLLSERFVYDEDIPQILRDKFKNQLSNVSALLAYDDPVNEASADLSAYLSHEYLQDRLFQIVNTSVLAFFHKGSGCDLENMIKYTRAMLATLVNFEADGSVVYNGTELRCFKILNMDEDLLNL